MKKIAIVVFIPNKKLLIEQFFGLYYSVMLNPRLRARTDFIIGCSPEITALFSLENCVVVHTNEISKGPEFRFLNRDNEYGYINSWSHFLDENSIDVILSYPYALRIDVDTFISPSILNIDLKEDEILVGQGGYIGGQETKNNLLRIASELALKHRGLHNLGSTWFSESASMISVGQAAVECVRHIMKNEFIDNEGEWPRWYAGVTLLYAGELALNHSPYTITRTKKLDSNSTSETAINDVFSIHAWHTKEFFSKHSFMSGKYDDRELSYNLDRGDNFSFLCARTGKLLYDSLVQNSSHEEHSATDVAQPIAPTTVVPTFTPIQAIRYAGELLKQALPKTPMFIFRRLKQKWFNRPKSKS